MRVVYVIYNERPANSLVATQVVPLLKEIRRQWCDLEIVLLAYWQPWVAIEYRCEIEQMTKDLATAQVAVRNCPLAAIPSRYFLYHRRLFPILKNWGSVLYKHTLPVGAEIVHCRSYFPSFLAAMQRDLGKYKLIFDMRSFWPKEHVSIGAWSEDDDIYRMWMEIERYTIEKSDAVIGVSEPMVDEVNQKTSSNKGVLIPVCVDTQQFRFDAEARKNLRRELQWDDRPIIAYQGSLGLLNRNIHEVAEYFRLIDEVMANARFLVLTANTKVDIAAIMMANGISKEKFAVRHPRQGELPKWLSAADAGIHAMSPGPDSNTRIGVKVAEYLSCGLPIIVNRYVGAAAKLAEDRGIGIVIDRLRREDALLDLTALLRQSDEQRERCRRVALDTFSIETCARKYVELYTRLVPNAA